MKDKYIIYFISRTKANMIKFIENNLKENEMCIRDSINIGPLKLSNSSFCFHQAFP